MISALALAATFAVLPLAGCESGGTDDGTGGKNEPTLLTEHEVTLNPRNVEVAQGQTSVEVDLISGLTSAGYTDEELESAQIAAAYTALPSGERQYLTLTDGKATLAVAENTDYRVNYTAMIGGSSVGGSFYVLGYYANMLSDFEDNGSISDSWFTLTTDMRMDGSYALRSQDGRSDSYTHGSSWTTYTLPAPKKLTKRCTTVSVWVYAPDARTVQKLDYPGWFYLHGTDASGNATAFHAKPADESLEISLGAGWNLVEYEVEPYASGRMQSRCTITRLEFYTAVGASGRTDLQDLVFDRFALK